MLPFLKPRRETGLIVQERKPDGLDSKKPEENQGLIACAEDLIRAVHAKDAKGVSEAIKAAFELLEVQPHDEIEHDSNEE